MKNQERAIIWMIFIFFCQIAYAQNDVSRFSGNLEMNTNFFLRDSAIGAFRQPQYDHQLYGADAWLQLNYSNWGFDIGARFDLFNNSNLLNPNGSYTAEGIGRWYLKKKIDKLTISGGYLYDQIGSGIIFRAYELRPLAIDNALYGILATYDLNDNWQLKGFTGKQKQQFGSYASILKGFSVDGFVQGKEGSNWSIAPGFGIVARTLDDQTMNTVVNTIASYSLVDSIGAKYNTYAMSFYNTLSYGDFSWYVEGAYKTGDQFFDPDAIKTNNNGETSVGKLVFDSGSILYTSLGYAANGWGITLDAKRTQNFTFRTNPFTSGVQGIIHFLPPVSRINTYRLTARYAPVVQEIGELAFQADIRYSPNRKWSFNLNVSNITTLDDDLLYREIFTEVSYKYKRKWTLLGGIQMQNYNQEVYEVKPGVPIAKTITPYAEFLYKFNRKKSLRIEGQYMFMNESELNGKTVKNDYGNWAFALAELTITPHWTFTISDMYNISPGKASPTSSSNSDEKLKIHYPRFDVFYTFGANRFSLSYVKQVEGIVCAGGICRLEPAFSGVKATINSTF